MSNFSTFKTLAGSFSYFEISSQKADIISLKEKMIEDLTKFYNTLHFVFANCIKSLNERLSS